MALHFNKLEFLSPNDAVRSLFEIGRVVEIIRSLQTGGQADRRMDGRAG